MFVRGFGLKPRKPKPNLNDANKPNANKPNANKSTFVTGFHMHPKHSVDYLHMHVICTNENMVHNANYRKQTADDKFIESENLIKFISPNRNSEKNRIERNKIKTLSNAAKTKLNKKLSTNQQTFFKDKNGKDKKMELWNINGKENSNKKYPSQFNYHINSYLRNDNTILHMDKYCIVFNNTDVTYSKNKLNQNGKPLKGQSTSKIHLLVIPWKPIYNCVALEAADVNLVYHMKEMGTMVGRELANRVRGNGIGEGQTYKQEIIDVMPHYIQSKVAYMGISEKFAVNEGWRARMDKVNGLETNRTLNKENFHFFTKFSENRTDEARDDKKLSRFEQMKKYYETINNNTNK